MHIIDPEKLAGTWGIPWEKREDNGEIVNENEFIFRLSGGQVFSLNHDEPNQIHLWANAHGQTTDWIGFNNITRVAYSAKTRSVAIESQGQDYFSDMHIKASGKFAIEIAKPIDLAHSSFCEILLKDSK